MQKTIAKRELFWSIKGSDIRNSFVVRVCAPYKVEKNEVPYEIDWVNDVGAIACKVETEGLEKDNKHIVYAIDEVQAINMASNIEPMLKGLSKKYDLFWINGDPYVN